MRPATISRYSLLGLIISFLMFSVGCTRAPAATSSPTAQPIAATATPDRQPTPEPPRPTAVPIIGLANPAASYCIEQGGQVEIQTTADGAQLGLCVFNDGTVCEEWAFLRGECAPGQQNQIDSNAVSDTTTLDPVVRELFTLVQGALPPNAFDTLAAQPLTSADHRLLWAVYSIGSRNFALESFTPHFVAIYAYTDTGWQLLGWQNLFDEDPDGNEPDVIVAVRQVNIVPDRIWLQIEGGVGAHGGSYHLFSFADDTLRLELAAFSASPDFGSLEDLDEDGIVEVVLDQSDRYVFCYACGVYSPYYQVYTWQNGAMVERTISDLTPEYQTASFAKQNRQALAFVKADLWAEALTAINAAVAAAGSIDPPTTGGTLRWNQRLIQKMHNAHLEAIANSAFPLLNRVFYGDYTGVVDQMRQTAPAEIFSTESPLIVGTVAEGWETTLGEHLISATERVLAIQPDRAEVFFVQSWGRFLVDATDPAIATDLDRAAQLQPDTPLFVESATWWKNR
ncbi:MAG: putative hemolysin [Chloroflexus sp.]|uniref:putative hemolysin n=1 Tax=Chloroflexus sp. TaxID=1904827 RepID=UPI00404B055C